MASDEFSKSREPLPKRHYQAGPNGAGTRFQLPDGKEVELERYENGKRVHFLWPTPLTMGKFFIAATGALGQEFIGATVNHSQLFVTRKELEGIDDYMPPSQVAIAEDLGQLIWQDFMRHHEYQGGVITHDLSRIAIGSLMAHTGNEAVIANLDTLVAQTNTELQRPINDVGIAEEQELEQELANARAAAAAAQLFPEGENPF
ncbi:MAG TPA: hypothetical protein VMR95_00030 [Candidatus Binatia bacterium]|jgi:hypothetical protein|nr:hypothetical protein [Candidatus Binatia bacterium]